MEFKPRIVDVAGYVHGKGRILRYRVRWRRPAWEGIRILGYHRVDTPRDRLSVSPARFRAQMEVLRASGVEPIALAEAYELMDAGFDGRYVCVTFDDGYLDNLVHALPVLEQCQIPATVFVATGLVDGTAPCTWYVRPPAFLDWQNIGELTRTGLIDVQPHSVTHRALPDLSDEEAESEIALSTSRLHAQLGVAPHTFCYPGGHFGEREVELVRQNGLCGAVTVLPGVNGSQSDRMALRRTMIADLDSVADFRAKLAGALDAPSAIARRRSATD